MTRNIPISTKNELFGRSAGLCNICKIDVMTNKCHNIAHIEAYSANGPRGTQDSIENNSYSNLILLCANCHNNVDKNPREYPSDFLKNKKVKHEEYISSLTNKNHETEKRDRDIYVINSLMNREYGNLANLQIFLDDLPYSCNITVLEFSRDILENYMLNPIYFPLNDKYLQKKIEILIYNLNKIFEMIDPGIGFSKDINGIGRNHFSGAGIDYIIYRLYHKGLIPDERNEEIDNHILYFKQETIKAHNDLISYLRDNYPETIYSS